MSDDKNVFVFESRPLRLLSRLVLSWIIISIMLVPVVIIRMSHSATVQIPCLMVASAFFLLTLAVVANARTTEMFIAGPTYVSMSAFEVIEIY